MNIAVQKVGGVGVKMLSCISSVVTKTGRRPANSLGGDGNMEMNANFDLDLSLNNCAPNNRKLFIISYN